MATLPAHLITAEQYVALDERSELLLEYFDGEVLQAEVGSTSHALIQVNLCRSIGNRILDAPCQGFGSSARVRVPSGGYFHLDLLVVSGQVQTLTDGTLLNPSVIFEIDSESNFDVGRKGVLYRSIETLKEYILIEQKFPWAQRWTRQSAGWQVEEYSGMDAVLPIATLNTEIDLREIYLKVQFEQEN